MTLIAAILISTFSLTKAQESDTSKYQYILNPNSSDKECINDIKRAKTDIESGQLKVTETFGFTPNALRFEDELKKLSRELGLEFEIELISDVIIEGQTQGCYSAYMDYALSEKYGLNFKRDLYRKADSLFIENIINNNRLVSNDFCDQSAEPSNDIQINPSIKVKNFRIVEDSANQFGNGFPFIDLGFIIEKNGEIGSFKIDYWLPASQANRRYKNQLLNLAIDEMKEKYSTWKPGRIVGIRARTEHSVRFFFQNEK
ncbi:hypothetical protein GBO34_03370 [Roseivirga pacifica]|nr:hypothetical protein [Roseivirga pacifica]MCO6360900.1 hypothetical protein [Roseivirga pacifica]MCO6377730.1 hypothetical protein [Roseivirga pacifica]